MIRSHHLMWIGSALVVFSLFMLSLAKPDKYYQVSFRIYRHMNLS